MTRHALRRLALAFTVALGGCVVSSQPVITPADATFDERLLGSWEEIGGPDRATVTRGAAGTYAIVLTNAHDTTRLDARLGRLGDRVVLDVWPVPRETELPSGYASLLLPGHVLLVMEIGAQEVAYSILEADTLLAVMEKAPAAPPYDTTGRRLALHGTSAELRALLTPHLGRPGALSNVERMRRVATPGPAR